MLYLYYYDKCGYHHGYHISLLITMICHIGIVSNIRNYANVWKKFFSIVHLIHAINIACFYYNFYTNGIILLRINKLRYYIIA